MIIIDFEGRSIRGYCKARDLKNELKALENLKVVQDTQNDK